MKYDTVTLPVYNLPDVYETLEGHGEVLHIYPHRNSYQSVTAVFSYEFDLQKERIHAQARARAEERDALFLNYTKTHTLWSRT